MKNKLLLTPVLLSTLMLVACNNEYSEQKSKEISAKVTRNIEADMNKAIDEAKLENKDVSIDMQDGSQAIISANGDLSIHDKKIDLTENQRALTKQYFEVSKQLGIQGLEIGKASAKLATQAIGTAIGGLMSGETDAQFEKKMEAKAGNIEAVAQKLCETALNLEAIQKKLMVALPAFTVVPMHVDKNEDGCSVNSNDNIHIRTDNKDDPAPPPPPPPAPPEPPKAPMI